ncbi:hypothetical protein Ccrd_014667 [Cynara cardunculus var. scolymus]|uniref:Uncharacterized protein n=1 Tax=Cynara cardunculus var. scolymus TaxID=59895 RepID=A0A103YDA8_CYNCS|nr:hypothetical protein Ccrd_014667 [Cynara cardunculus var. scolymus]
MKGEDLQGLDLKGLDKLEAVIESGLVEVVKTNVKKHSTKAHNACCVGSSLGDLKSITAVIFGELFCEGQESCYNCHRSNSVKLSSQKQEPKL